METADSYGASTSGGYYRPPTSSFQRLYNFSRYTLVEREKSREFPPVPEEVSDILYQSGAAACLGTLVGAVTYLRIPHGALHAQLRQSLTVEAQARVMAEMQLMRLASIARTACRGGIIFGAAGALYFSSSLLSSVWRGRRSWVDSVVGGMVAGSGRGALQWWQPLGAARRVLVASVGMVGGLLVGLAVGGTQEAVLLLLPPRILEHHRQLQSQTRAIAEGRIHGEPPAGDAAASVRSVEAAPGPRARASTSHAALPHVDPAQDAPGGMADIIGRLEASLQHGRSDATGADGGGTR